VPGFVRSSDRADRALVGNEKADPRTAKYALSRDSGQQRHASCYLDPARDRFGFRGIARALRLWPDFDRR